MSLQIKKEAYIFLLPDWALCRLSGRNNLQKVTVSQIIGKQHPCNSKQQSVRDKGKYNSVSFNSQYSNLLLFLHSDHYFH